MKRLRHRRGRDARAASASTALRPALSVKNLSYRYAEGEPDVLRGVNLRIEAGESVTAPALYFENNTAQTLAHALGLGPAGCVQRPCDGPNSARSSTSFGATFCVGQ